VQGFFFVEKRMCCFSSKTRVVFRPLSILFFQNMHLSFNLLEGLNLTIPIEMLRCVFLDPPLLKESLRIFEVSHLRTQTLGLGPR